MSKTNAFPDFHPIIQALGSKPSPAPKSIPASSQDYPCPHAAEERGADALEIAALRAFFELLDEWDRNGTGE